MSRARAYTNIALVKYWGKRDPQQMLPFNSSLSLTLDQFYTETSVTFVDDVADQFYLDGEVQPVSAKITHVIDLVRAQSGLQKAALIRSDNHVPNAAGLASSASAFAALALAASTAAGLKLSRRELSILARHGSGSASRSIYGGFVVWHAGQDDQSSFAEPAIANTEQVDFPIAILAVLVDQSQKKVSSSAGMAASVATSPFYPVWARTAEAAIPKMTAAIAAKAVDKIGALAETNAMQMHATTLSADPPFTYFEPETLQIWEKAREIRRKGLNCYVTLDAGPNPKLICQLQDVEKIIHEFQKEFPNLTFTSCRPGPGAYLVNE
ncbi:diphosphomevalonate decarboxylase [Lapidilactobacillus concavus DSM 17758]|jgi:diphosphomevalonate decarboxylase|uniref:diphosphomevalonate decarboxylase n=1 Tax=Lapidilactobacillus concavus DSM 17758 TaxID=1423735 RepID=A0A0R1W4X4_9LACO|nr:diphosphomevalonate decarboxylase [Lapidilactobacillus concavus]KRM10681.1 diphosphomevalonate decarboxylase [Lapidilactobacillus concavus DSM 17758]GEL12498.1 diphosphomevalonate decarboxylase [Lapidilactobacillus concavus]